MRALIHFPIIHSQKDLGSLAPAVGDTRIDAQSHMRLEAAEQFWLMVAATIEGLGLDYTNLKLYQDGLPVCGKEAEIVADVAASGSQNYLLLQILIEKGATLMGTESAELLVQEHALMKQLLTSGERSDVTYGKAQALLGQRDEYIAKRIDETLQEGELALLFLGLMHNVELILSKDIKLIQPFGKPDIGEGRLVDSQTQG